MGRMPRITYLWPGLPQLWLRGSWSALAVAVAVAVLVNVALVATFVWSELIPADVRSALWIVLIAIWTASAVYAEISGRRLAASEFDDPQGDSFAEALEHCLKGDYFQAERIATNLLRLDARDLDARLMLATLMRHTGRIREASEQLDVLVGMEGAGKWELEISQERERLAEAAQRRESQTAEQAAGESNEPPADVMHAA